MYLEKITESVSHSSFLGDHDETFSSEILIKFYKFSLKLGSFLSNDSLYIFLCFLS